MIKKKFFTRKLIKSTNSSYIILRKYSAETIVSAFEYFCFSRSCYSRLRRDFELPSISTLSRLTSITKNRDDTTFLQSVISSLNNRQKNAVFLIDEVYVKPTLQCRGGTLFDHAANKPDVFANTILTFMLKFIGGPKFVCKFYTSRAIYLFYTYFYSGKFILYWWPKVYTSQATRRQFSFPTHPATFIYHQRLQSSSSCDHLRHKQGESNFFLGCLTPKQTVHGKPRVIFFCFTMMHMCQKVRINN